MTNARLQLVFLGQLINEETDVVRAPCAIVGAPIATEHQEELVLWHDLDADEAQRLAGSAHAREGLHAEDRQGVDQHDVDQAPTAAPPAAAVEKSTEWTPFPVIEDIADEPPARKAATPAPMRRSSRLTRPLPPPPKAKTGAAAREVKCPNCGAYQTMRVLCRGCASFLEVALKAKAEREANAKAQARSRGLFAMLGL